MHIIKLLLVELQIGGQEVGDIHVPFTCNHVLQSQIHCFMEAANFRNFVMLLCMYI